MKKYIQKLLGKKEGALPKGEEKEEVLTSAHDENLIKVYDEYGRELFIDRDTWINDIFIPNLEDSYDKPADLYSVIIQGLDDGFDEYLIDASTKLYQIDSNKERGACLHAIVLMKNGKLVEAEAVINETMLEIGETGVLLTNLAKVYADQSKEKLSYDTLWHALEVEPNQDNGLDWFMSINRESSGEEGVILCLKKVEALKGAWLPKVWLARKALENNDLKPALNYYSEIFSLAPFLDAQVLQQISGDLGKAGYIQEILDVVIPVFNIDQHGYVVGNNLIKGHLEVKQVEEAQNLVNALFAKNRIDWKEGLNYWQDQLDEIKGNFGKVDPDKPPEIGLRILRSPAWIGKLENGSDLIPDKENDSLVIAAISASCSSNAEREAVGRTDKRGALSRGTLLTLCDRINVLTNAKSSFVFTSVDDGGFALIGARHKDSVAVSIAEQASADVVILPHLYAEGSKWKFEWRIFITDMSKPAHVIQKEFEQGNEAIKLLELVESAFSIICELPKLKLLKSNVDVLGHDQSLFAHIVDANESCLALTLANNGEVGDSMLYGERHIFDKLLGLAVNNPNYDVFKLMYVSALGKNKAYKSDIYLEYEKKTKKMIDDWADGSLAKKISQNTLAEIFN